MIRQHHQLNGHEFEQTLGDSEGQKSLERGSLWGHKEPDMTQRSSNNNQFSSVAQSCLTLCNTTIKI